MHHYLAAVRTTHHFSGPVLQPSVVRWRLLPWFCYKLLFWSKFSGLNTALGFPWSSHLGLSLPLRLVCPQQRFPSAGVHPLPTAALPVGVMARFPALKFIVVVLPLCRWLWSVCLCCPTVQDSDVWCFGRQVPPSSWLALPMSPSLTRCWPR